MDDLVDSEVSKALDARLDAATFLNRAVAGAQCLQMGAIRDAVLLARRNPELYVFAVSGQSRAEQVRLAERSVILDLALRLSLPENTVWCQFDDADTLINRMPRLWSEFRGGHTAYQNVRTAATTARSIPEDSGVFEKLDAMLVEKATRLTPSKFRVAARVARERLHPVDPAERHRAARADRRVEFEPADDGMAWMHLYTDAPTLTKIRSRLREAATNQRALPGETCTLAQLQADAAGDVLTGKGTAFEVKTHVQITIPVTALLEKPDLLAKARLDPAVLDGYGPIDQETARVLTADAPSFRRIFTDPIDGVDLNMGRTSYRPTSAQREWLRRKHRTCVMPTCSRPAAESDIDHTRDWQFHGVTDDDNLAPLSREHHTLKHKTKLKVERRPEGEYTWTTPTGFSRNSDPPPF